MKTKFLLIGAFVLITIGLSGCFWQEEEKPEQKSEEISADTILDNKLFEDAVALNDASKCNEIKSAAKKEECTTVLSSIDLINRAEQEKNESLCDQIKLERYRAVCETDVEKAIAEEKEEETTQSVEQEAIKKHDQKICDQIKDENQKAACKFNVTSD